MTRALFSLTIFAGSFLLFLIQPMVGKILLPALGGSSAVWTACMLFFQAALLAGYLYAEKCIRLLGCARQSMLHLMLMIGSWLLLPVNISLSGVELAHASPVSWLIGRLTFSIGLLFFLLAANAPLVQRYYAQSGQPDADDPYFLYSASNAGSLLALLAFPLIFEPLMGAAHLRQLWSAGYIFLTLFLSLCSFVTWNPAGVASNTKNEPGTPGQNKHDTGSLQNDDCSNTSAEIDFTEIIAHAELNKFLVPQQISWRQLIIWAFYGFVPCSIMLGVTTHITTDIASAPLLWIVPLAGYLSSFILVFAKTAFWRQIRWERYLFAVVLLAILMYYFVLNEPVWLSLSLHLLCMLLACMYFHSRLALSRPAVCHLNSFYVWMSAGGVAAGLFNSVFAPLFFETQSEYLLTLALTLATVSLTADYRLREGLTCRRETLISGLFSLTFCLLIYFSRKGADSLFSIDTGKQLVFLLFTLFFFFRQPVKTGTIMIIIFAMMQMVGSPADSRVIYRERTFFGILKVSRLATDGETRDPDLKIAGVADIFHRLHHGNTLHGVERRVKVRYQLPLSYYSREGPIGSLFKTGLVNRNCKNIGVIGLGCGTVAWYGRSWQHFDFFEIDPAVIRIAQNPDFFSFLSNSQASWRIIAGDARIMLQTVPDNSYDLMIIDAYSSGSVPMHLLTLQAFELYRAKIKDDGLIIFHISNRYLKLEPVIRRICDQLGLGCLEAFYEPEKNSIRYDWYDFDQMAGSHWVAASPGHEKLNMLSNTGLWKPLPAYAHYKMWTDDYANLLQVYNWR